MARTRNATDAKGKRHLLSVVIPAYNEEKTIAKVLDQVFAVAPRLERTLRTAMEVVVVDDGSRDRTAKRVHDYIRKHPSLPLRLLSKENGGKGSAIRAGIHAAHGSLFICQDADLEYDPADYLRVIKPLVKEGAEVVYGSREMHHNNHWSTFSFYLGGKGVTLATNLLFGAKLSDEPTCYKAFDLRLLRAIPLEGNGFEWEPEVTAKVLRLGIPIHEVPINYHPRSALEGKKIKWRDGVIAFRTLLAWRFRRFKLHPTRATHSNTKGPRTRQGKRR